MWHQKTPIHLKIKAGWGKGGGDDVCVCVCVCVCVEGRRGVKYAPSTQLVPPFVLPFLPAALALQQLPAQPGLSPALLSAEMVFGAVHAVVAAVVQRARLARVRACARKRAVIYFGWVFFLISLGSPHVRPMGRTRGEPNEIELTPIGVRLNGSGHVHLAVGSMSVCWTNPWKSLVLTGKARTHVSSSYGLSVAANQSRQGQLAKTDYRQRHATSGSAVFLGSIFLFFWARVAGCGQKVLRGAAHSLAARRRA